MVSESTRQKMRIAYEKRIARGEKFGFQKGHPNFVPSQSPEVIAKRIATFKANHIPKPKPSCEVCGIELWKWKDKRCRQHTDYSFRKGMNMGHFSSLKGKKLNLTLEQLERRREIGRQRRGNIPLEVREKMRAWQVAHPNRKFKDTSIELAIQQELIAQHILFYKQYVIQGIAIVDFFLPEFNLIIQCDGCYWHNCLQHYPMHHQDQRVKDGKKDSLLKQKGFTIFRFWEHEIKKSAKDCVDSLNLI